MSDPAPVVALPKTIPALTGSDICRHVLSNGFGRYCLYGWVWKLYAATVSDIGDIGSTGLGAALDESAVRLGYYTALHLNDSPKKTESDIAEFWNKTAESLGYVRDGNSYVLPGGQP